MTCPGEPAVVRVPFGHVAAGTRPVSHLFSDWMRVEDAASWEGAAQGRILRDQPSPSRDGHQALRVVGMQMGHALWVLACRLVLLQPTVGSAV